MNKLDYEGYAQKDDQSRCVYSEDKHCPVSIACRFALQQHVRALTIGHARELHLKFVHYPCKQPCYQIRK